MGFMKPLDRTALLELTKTLAQPVDFADLEKRGIISKAGAWYRLLKPESLPEHASRKIYELQQDAKGVKVKFEKASKYEKLLKKFEKELS